ncbi:MAG: LysM peptidoglycan-binding domain-containing M23 family metallopeptidase [Micavibrio sp.]
MIRFSSRCAPLLLAGAALWLSSCTPLTGTQKPADVANYGQQGGAGTTGMHTVQGGETLYAVSQRYKLPLREIISLNGLDAPYTLHAGYRLRLPPPNDYKVKSGDTLNGIARLFNVSVSEVARVNELAPPYVIQRGQVLRMPSRQPKLEQDFAQDAPSPSFLGGGGDATTLAAKPGAVESEELAPLAGAGQQGGGAATAAGTQTASVAPAGTQGASPPSPSTAQPALQQGTPPKATQASAALPSNVAPKIPPRSNARKFMRPVDGQVISAYGPKADGLHNDGINIRAARGTSVRAAENGVVAYVGNEMAGYGNLILIRHADRWMTAYAHMDKTLVKKNDVVKAGQAIGTVGSTGQVSAPQLHFEIRQGTKAVNPNSFL